MENDTILFTVDDIDIFAKVSHDRSPLHCNNEYARKTPYGEPVVHGILGVFACLGKFVELDNNVFITAMEVKFFAPLFCNVCYTLSVKTVRNSEAEMIITDGETKILKIKVVYKGGLGIAINNRQSSIPFFEMQAKDLDYNEIVQGKGYDGEYSPLIDDAFYNLLAKFGLQSASLEYLVILLMWSSYSVGMIVPGKQALYSDINLEIEPNLTEADLTLPIRYEVKIDKLDTRFNLLFMGFSCFSSSGV
ncbi:hypothetical protein AGMMS50268_36780 [Spirochaetia bacterium]|nr:hypothetical protein AGMMS50268_36780 [Spirochaetia bacterium]